MRKTAIAAVAVVVGGSRMSPQKGGDCSDDLIRINDEAEDND